jgi:hypothetical protein
MILSCGHTFCRQCIKQSQQCHTCCVETTLVVKNYDLAALMEISAVECQGCIRNAIFACRTCLAVACGSCSLRHNCVSFPKIELTDESLEHHLRNHINALLGSEEWYDPHSSSCQKLLELYRTIRLECSCSRHIPFYYSEETYVLYCRQCAPPRSLVLEKLPIPSGDYLFAKLSEVIKELTYAGQESPQVVARRHAVTDELIQLVDQYPDLSLSNSAKLLTLLTTQLVCVYDQDYPCFRVLPPSGPSCVMRFNSLLPPISFTKLGLKFNRPYRVSRDQVELLGLTVSKPVTLLGAVFASSFEGQGSVEDIEVLDTLQDSKCQQALLTEHCRTLMKDTSTTPLLTRSQVLMFSTPVRLKTSVYLIKFKLRGKLFYRGNPSDSLSEGNMVLGPDSTTFRFIQSECQHAEYVVKPRAQNHITSVLIGLLYQ